MTGIAIACVVATGIIALWKTIAVHDLRYRISAADACIETQRIAVEALVVKLEERKAEREALYVALTAAHDAAQRGDVDRLIVSLRYARMVVDGDA